MEGARTGAGVDSSAGCTVSSTASTASTASSLSESDVSIIWAASGGLICCCCTVSSTASTASSLSESDVSIWETTTATGSRCPASSFLFSSHLSTFPVLTTSMRSLASKSALAPRGDRIRWPNKRQRSRTWGS